MPKLTPEELKELERSDDLRVLALVAEFKNAIRVLHLQNTCGHYVQDRDHSVLDLNTGRVVPCRCQNLAKELTSTWLLSLQTI